MEREKQNDPRHFILDSRRKALFPQTKLNKRPNTSKRRELSNQDNFDWYCGPTEIVNVKLSEKNGQKYKLDCSKYGNPSLRSRLTYQIAPSLSTDTKFRGWDVLV